MQINLFIIIFTFVVIIAIIVLSDSLTTAILFISLAANFLIISSQLSSLTNIDVSFGSSDEKQADPSISTETLTELNLYGNDYYNHIKENSSYTDAYEPPKPVVYDNISELAQNGDIAAVMMAQARGDRAKKSLDGHWSKNANYYKYNFADELEESEAKPWWGRNEE